MTQSHAFLSTIPGWTRRHGARHVIHVEPLADMRLAFSEAVARGLEDQPRWLSCTFLYDSSGSEIFERITEQPEYYQTRTEDGILAAHADNLRALVGDVSLVELGSGSSSKTRHLLGAWTRQGPSRYVPIDVSDSAVEAACEELVQAYPNLEIEAFATTYDRALPLMAHHSPLLLLFLGSTIGNFNPTELDTFLDMLAGHLRHGDHFLLGIDLVKDTARLEAAYNDAAGYTARFVVNMFARMNRELGTSIPLDAVHHVAYYNNRLERIEIYARFSREVSIDLPLIGRSYRLAPGEMVLTEISRKFRPDDVAANLSRFGFALEKVHTDADSLFAVLLFRRRREVPYAESRRESVQDLLRRVRARTLDLISPLRDQTDPDPARAAWIEAAVPHLEAILNYEKAWLVEAVEHGTPAAPSTTPLEERPPAPLEAVLGSMNEVRRQVLDRLAAAPLHAGQAVTRGGRIYRRVCQHEARQQERMLEQIQARPEYPFHPTPGELPPPRPAPSTARGLTLIPAGEFRMGSPRELAMRDCEQPAHLVDLPAYLMGSAPVTNGDYQGFMDDGGYRRRELWSAEGWRWKQDNEIDSPGSWRPEAGFWSVSSFGRWHVMDPRRPVVHVSWYEADAFARWRDKRLPTEAEWEKAAAWDPERGSARLYPWGDRPASAERANLDQRLREVTPVGSYSAGRSFYGCHQMLGDVWEWTASPFNPYPGFTPFPDRLRSTTEFSRRFRVLRGGSWATLAAAISCASRRWHDPGGRQAFSGFRLAGEP